MKIGDPKSKGGRRMPTLVGFPSPFQPGKLSRDPKDVRSQARPPVILDHMKKGGTRQEIYYFENSAGQKVFSIKLNISCDSPKRVYSIDIMNVDFGGGLPNSATLKFSGNRRTLTSHPVRLVANGRPLPRPYVSIVLDPSIETIALEIEIEGSAALPRYLSAAIRNRLGK